MRALGRVVVVLALAAALGAAVLWIALPGNRAPGEGPPDPILFVRRPALEVLRGVGLASGEGALPWGFGWATDEWEATWRNEPVYRGLFWLVGARVTYTTTAAGERRALRLCYVEDGHKVVAARNADLDARGRGSVTGFVPHGAAGYWAEEEDAAGRSGWLHACGDVDPDAWP